MIETERLILRPPVASDLAWQQAHLNTAAVTRHLGGVRPDGDVARSFESNAGAIERGEPGMLTVMLRQSGEPIGKCGLSRIETPAAPATLRGGIQIGWSLAEPFWGHGFAAEAARAVLVHGFATLDERWIWAQTSASNRGSTRMMDRLGFARLAELDYVDPDYPAPDNPTTVYRMLRPAGSLAA